MKMKITRVALVLAALSPAFQAGAVDLAMNGNPYTPIVARNIFGLVPIPTNAPAVAPASLNPPPKIIPNGIMTIFGVKEALFKVAVPAKPGKPAADQAYTLSEGESQDDIEVIKIDDQADVITFNNHGVTQELPLVAAAASEGSAVASAPSSGPAFGGGHFPRPMGGPGGFPGRRGLPPPNSGGEAPNTSSSNDNSANTIPDNVATPTGIGNNPEMNGLSPEAQALLIENNYMEAKAKNDPSAPLFPPTPLRDQADAESGGK